MMRLNEKLDPNRTGRDAEVLYSNLRDLVVGQDEAIHQIVSTYEMDLTGMNAPNRPVGMFLFLGPTGTGKTRMVEPPRPDQQSTRGDQNRLRRISA